MDDRDDRSLHLEQRDDLSFGVKDIKPQMEEMIAPLYFRGPICLASHVKQLEICLLGPRYLRMIQANLCLLF